VSSEAEAEADRDVHARVREHLQPGETFRAAVWVSRADAPQGPGGRRGVQGWPGSRGLALDEHVRIVTDPRVLALTDRRLMVLSKRLGSWRDLLRPGSGAPQSLRVRWECPRADLASAAEKAGRLRLTFTDGSAVTLLTPSTHVRPFLDGSSQ
jgi:hypothetical protein